MEDYIDLYQYSQINENTSNDLNQFLYQNIEPLIEAGHWLSLFMP